MNRQLDLMISRLQKKKINKKAWVSNISHNFLFTKKIIKNQDSDEDKDILRYIRKLPDYKEKYYVTSS